MILIVDDQPDIGHCLELLLECSGHHAIAVDSGAAALRILRLCKPALIVLDVNMPNMDGLTVLKTIKAQNELKEVPAVMYSANDNPATKEEAKRLGAVDFFVKSTTGLDELVERIGKLAGELN